MKKAIHSNRKSFATWGKLGQLTAPITTQQHRDATRNQRRPSYGAMASAAIAYAPRSLFGRAANRYAEGDVRPSVLDVKAARRSRNAFYGMLETGELRRVDRRLKVKNGKSTRRLAIKERREDRALAAANLAKIS